MKINTTAIVKQVSRIGKFALEHKHGLLKTAEIVTGVGAVTYAIAKTPEAVRSVEDAGMKKGEALTTGEKVKTVMGVMWPVALVGGAHIGFRTAYDISTSRQLKAVTAANKGLVEQLVEMSTMYSTANDIKTAIQKKLEAKYTPEEIEEIKKEAVSEQAKAVSERIKVNDTRSITYSTANSRVNEWNDIYLRTGDPNYKVCTFLDIGSGQKFLSCLHAVYEARDTFKARLADEKYGGQGFVPYSEWLEMIGGHPGTYLENYLFRAYDDWFDITIDSYNDDGDLCWAIYIDNMPFYDMSHEY